MRAIVGLFFSEFDNERDDEPPPFSFGQASSLESDTAKLRGIPLKSLADNWRILAVVESGIEANLGVDARSMEKQADSLWGLTEALLYEKRYEQALRSQNIVEALRAGAAAVWVTTLFRDASKDQDPLSRVPLSGLSLPDPKAMVGDQSLRKKIERLPIDAVLYHTIVADKPLDHSFLDGLRHGLEMIFGDDPDLASIFKTLSGDLEVGPASPMPLLYAAAAAIPDGSVIGDPSLRFYRDAMVTICINSSLGRGALASAAATKIAAGWRFVLDHQRFMMSSPASHVPAIDLAIAKMKKPAPKLGDAANLLLAVAPAVGGDARKGVLDLLSQISLSASSPRLGKS